MRKAPFVNDQGEVIGTVGSARDITEHKRAEETLRQSEELFRVLFDDAPLPHQSMDQNGCLLLANDAWLAALGYKREEVIGQSFGTFLHPDCIGYFKENFPKFLDCGLMVDAEFTMRRKDGSTLLASFDGRVSRDSKGQFQRTHCTFQDVTELRRAEDALKKAKAEAEAASLAKGAAKPGHGTVGSVSADDVLAVARQNLRRRHHDLLVLGVARDAHPQYRWALIPVNAAGGRGDQRQSASQGAEENAAHETSAQYVSSLADHRARGEVFRVDTADAAAADHRQIQKTGLHNAS